MPKPAFSFIITSSLVNEVAFVIMDGLFGWKLAFLYAISGITLGIIGGLFLGSLKLDNEIILNNGSDVRKIAEMPRIFRKKIEFSLRQGLRTFKKLLPYVLGGIGLGASLAFMMSIAGLSLPEAIILKRVMTIKLLAIFFSSVAVGIIVIGYLFNFIS